MLVLPRHSQTARGLRSSFYHRILLSEGRTRSALEQLVTAVNSSVGKPGVLAAVVTIFLAGARASAFRQSYPEQIRVIRMQGALPELVAADPHWDIHRDAAGRNSRASMARPARNYLRAVHRARV
jgi:hypothetical protein